jgi:hypothetical protein
VITLAAALLLVGSCLITMGAVEMACCPQDHWLAMLILGTLAFIPGAYHTHTAVLAWRGHRDYSFSQLPNVI